MREKPALPDGPKERWRRLDRGARAEALVALMLRLRGYAILARRWKISAGEIDLVVSRGVEIRFVEVKRTRGTADSDAHEAVSSGQRRRIRDAADVWLLKNPRYREHEMHFDLALVAPWRMPRFIADGL
ncbi:MAG: YraN family protein [Hyphomicrobium sp.]|nr:YraN family protein [Hyphomicrobium sp.]